MVEKISLFIDRLRQSLLQNPTMFLLCGNPVLGRTQLECFRQRFWNVSYQQLRRG